MDTSKKTRCGSTPFTSQRLSVGPKRHRSIRIHTSTYNDTSKHKRGLNGFPTVESQLFSIFLGAPQVKVQYIKVCAVR